ncbi:2-methoxy-6-polyprenyl-1,4-benzoquinol methylase, mitochondrial-like [Octopus vulgaris]|uniref:2-methoxy-6-polyprenyl-1,4-benzoquinol methylase, mitochondrial n=2 Tax=Octopus vulgaris TaxID=6645 RepID=A0AA36BW65_OCTVU|nr:2-methoxy-6-polyprenyl-1,4-benzoquinol methylase, mitochondrial-like [Octopus vulgaris]
MFTKMSSGLAARRVCRRLFLLNRQCLTTLQHRNLSEEPRTEQETHFGFQSIPESEKESKVHEVFKNVANKYDLMNDAMSVGIHRLWKDYFIRQLAPTCETKLVDVAGGTGDIAYRFLNYVKHLRADLPNDAEDFDQLIKDEFVTISSSPEVEKDAAVGASAQVTVCDINQSMLDVGQKRCEELGYDPASIKWVQGNAESLPLEDNQFDAYTIAFGIRNVTHIDKALEEAYRVLRPGGRFLCLEFSQVPNFAIRNVYDFYSFQVIPVLGQVLAGDWKSYQYLIESIRQFPDQEQFASMIRAAGFRMVTYENLTFGVTALHSGFKL